jgi:hydroxymethylpyrimidine/phosphomethylpyrimidine kinase
MVSMSALMPAPPQGSSPDKTKTASFNLAELITKQFHHLQADIDFKVVKIGLLCASEQIRVIADLVQDKTIVLDPIIKASSEETLLQTQAIDTLKQDLLPLVKIITPNMAELHALSGEKDEQKAIEKLACEWVLLHLKINICL